MHIDVFYLFHPLLARAYRYIFFPSITATETMHVYPESAYVNTGVTRLNLEACRLALLMQCSKLPVVSKYLFLRLIHSMNCYEDCRTHVSVDSLKLVYIPETIYSDIRN